MFSFLILTTVGIISLGRLTHYNVLVKSIQKSVYLCLIVAPIELIATKVLRVLKLSSRKQIICKSNIV